MKISSHLITVNVLSMAVLTVKSSISEAASILSSTLYSSALEVASELYQTNHFQSNAGGTSALSVSIPSDHDLSSGCVPALSPCT
jgi:hypothetical protein